MIRRPPRSTLDRSSAASDVYKRQDVIKSKTGEGNFEKREFKFDGNVNGKIRGNVKDLSLIHISEPTRPY